MKIEDINISCDVCLDLIPLVLDNVASDDSTTLVNEHVKSCESCKTEFNSENHGEKFKTDDEKIIKAIRKSIIYIGCGLLTIGIIVGIIVSNSMGMFYNLIIMPTIGALSYLIFNKKWYLVSGVIFVAAYIWQFILFSLDGAFASGFALWAIYTPVFLAGIYSALSILGVIIAALFKFAFRKEVTK
ncbi:MAG: zf-HC2 domain-containing protein [Clostridium sp.]|uniref:zf-HC2 domain-containing protein n=1 Tax=Clostridium sp. TaxID=1506 RepID=UPI003041C4F7